MFDLVFFLSFQFSARVTVRHFRLQRAQFRFQIVVRHDQRFQRIANVTASRLKGLARCGVKIAARSDDLGHTGCMYNCTR